MNLLNAEDEKVKENAFNLLHLIVTINCEKDISIKEALIKNWGMLKEWLDDYHLAEEPEDFSLKKKNIIDDIDRMAFA